MGYYMRYIVADQRPVTLEDVRRALTEAGDAYEVDGEDPEATISYRGYRVGHLTLNAPGDGLFAAIDPVWRWLHANRRGLLQADGEGYYDTRELILKLD